MLKEAFMVFYQDFKEFYTLHVLIMVFIIGVYCVLVDYKTLKDKKLKKEAKLCKWMGMFYIFGGIGLFVLVKIF